MSAHVFWSGFQTDSSSQTFIRTWSCRTTRTILILLNWFEAHTRTILILLNWFEAHTRTVLILLNWFETSWTGKLGDAAAITSYCMIHNAIIEASDQEKQRNSPFLPRSVNRCFMVLVSGNKWCEVYKKYLELLKVSRRYVWVYYNFKLF